MQRWGHHQDAAQDLSWLFLDGVAALPSPDVPSLPSGDLEPSRTLPFVGCFYFLPLHLTDLRVLCSLGWTDNTSGCIWLQKYFFLLKCYLSAERFQYF